MVHKENLQAELLHSVPAKYRPKLRKAIAVAVRNYSQVLRLSGEPLLDHVLRSAKYYAELHIDFNGIVATLLHHALPEDEYKNDEIFNDDVLGLLKNVETVFSNARKESVDTRVIYKYILSFQDDIRIALIKLSEKFDNAKTIDLLPTEKRKDVARRLLKIYTPLAEYMNLIEAKKTFELNGFRVLYPNAYQEVAQFVHDKQGQLFSKIEEIRGVIESIASIVNVEGQVWGRMKSYYGIWKKQFKHSKEGKSSEIDSFNDLLAFTVMVESIDQCYSVAYAIKDYAMVEDRYFEDYIRNPKPNGFSEIQVVAQFPELAGTNVEIQILTKEMYWQNTYGPASHFAYKLSERRFAKQSSEFQWVEIVHREIEQSNATMELPLSKPLQLHLFQDKIFAFTPKHRVIVLGKGATAIDFAYQVHTSIGHSANFAKVNGVIVPLSTELDSGDLVEIVTDSRKKYPTESWLQFAKSKSTQTKIKYGLRKKLIAEGLR